MISRLSGRLIAALALAGSVVYPANAAREPIQLAPSSQWEINYAADSCRLARQFGTGDWTTLLILDRFEPDDYFRVTMVGKRLKRRGESGDAKLQFGPTEAEQKIDFLVGETANRPSLVFSQAMRITPLTDSEKEKLEAQYNPDVRQRFELPPIAPEREAAIMFLSLQLSGMPKVVLDTGSLGAPMNAFRKCMDELLSHWGIDVARHASLSKKLMPAEAPANWLRSSDYPMDLLRKGAQGLVHFRLSVDSEGKPTDCHIQRSTRPEGFDTAVCAALKRRARFEPALDKDGKPLASYYVNSVRFEIP